MIREDRERGRKRERESETESERPLVSLSYVSLSLSLKWFRNGAFVISFFPQRQRQMQSGEKGQRGRILEGKGWGVKGEGKREASGQYTRTRANFKAKHPKGGEKERREQKLLGHNFFLFLFSSFSFLFFFFGESSKARFLRDCATIRVSQVKSSQVRQEEEQGEQGGRAREREGEGGRGCLYVCACFCVFVCL